MSETLLSEPGILHLFLSPGHNYFGQHGGPAGEYPIVAVPEIECLANRGIRGDRFLDFKPDYKGQITFFAWEDLVRMWSDLNVSEGFQNPAACRRNVITHGWDPVSGIGREFVIQGVRFLGTEECRPCYWMNTAIHPHAETWMKGRGGLRAKILTDGILRRTTSSPAR